MASRKLVIEFIGDTSSLDRATKRAKGTGGSLRGLGSAAVAASAGVAGLVVVGGRLVKAYEESAKVSRQTRAVLRSTGGVANVTAGDVDRLATATSRKTGIDDEAVASSSNLLLTFKNIRNETGKGRDVFNQATQAAVDLSAAGFGSLESTSKQLGKALNDPVKGITALGRAGVTFSQEQKQAIAALMETGRASDRVKAQQMILREVMSQVGGSAEAQATPFDRLRVTFENLQETLGAHLAPMAEKAAAALDKFLGEMQSGEGAGGRFVATLKDLWAQTQPVAAGMLRIAKGVGEFVAKHPWVVKVAAAMAAVGLAVRGIVFASKISGLSAFLSAAKTGAQTFKGIWAGAGTLAGRLAGENVGVGYKGRAGSIRGAVLSTKAGIVSAFAKIGAAGGAAMAAAAAVALPALVALVLREVGNAVKRALNPKGKGDSGPIQGDKNNAWDLVKSLFGKAAGGPITGGVAGRDSVPALLMPGEHVLTAGEVRNAGGHGAVFALRRALGGGGQAAGVAYGAGGWAKDAEPGAVGGLNSKARRGELAWMREAWGHVAPFLPGAGKGMPAMSFSKSSLFAGMSGGYHKGRMFWPDWLWRGKDRISKAQQLSLLVHEWAHAFQRGDLGGTDAEGGATLFARRVAPGVAAAMGLPYSQPFNRDQYVPEMRKAKRRGEPWIMRGQFRKMAAGGAVGRVSGAAGGTWDWAKAFAAKYGLRVTSNYRTAAQNRAAGGVANSWHMKGSPASPQAFDFVPASQKAAGAARAMGAKEVLIHDAGSGLHLHVGGLSAVASSVGGGASASGGWRTGTATWYKPSSGGINGREGAGAWAGHPVYDTTWGCAAPPEFAFGTLIEFQYKGRSVVCPVVDRGGAIKGTRFDLLPRPAKALGMQSAGRVAVRFRARGKQRPGKPRMQAFRQTGSTFDTARRRSNTNRGIRRDVNAKRMERADSAREGAWLLAGLTPDLKDDLDAASAGFNAADIRVRQYAHGLRFGDKRVTPSMLSDAISARDEWQGRLDKLREPVADTGGTSAPDGSGSDLAAILESIEAGIREQNDRAKLIGSTSGGVLARAVADVASGQIGGQVIRGAQTPMWAGSGARY